MNKGSARRSTKRNSWLQEAEQTLRAIKAGDVDGLVVSVGDSRKVFTLNDEQLLRKVQTELQQRVRERTAKLSQLNQKLKDEIFLRKRTEQELRNNEIRLQAFIEARERLSRDLHDNIIQSIYGIGLSIEECRELFEENRSRQAIVGLTRAITNLNSVMAAVRAHLTPGEPLLITSKHLASSLERLAGMGGARYAFSLNLKRLAPGLLTDQEATELLAIAQEAISNSVRHSKARERIVRLGLRAGHILFEVTDDGVGFDPQSATAKGHGLRNMGARAKSLGWQIEIFSKSNMRSGIKVKIPKKTSRSKQRDHAA